MRKENERQFAVLGLGVFGSTVVKTLSKYDSEVIAIDRDEGCVQRLADIATLSVKGDITNIEALRSAGVADCDVAIVAVGSHLEESVMAVLNLVDLGVPIIVAKAKNKRYKEILYKVGATKVVRPEKEMGAATAKGLLNKNIIEMIDLDDDYSVVEIQVPKRWVGKNLLELDLRNEYGVNILGIKSAHEKLNVTPDPNYNMKEDDHILIISDTETFNQIDFIDA